MLAGGHFGHRTRFWNPKMAPYIYGTYYQTHIINLDHTLSGLEKASEFFGSVSLDGGTILYVCAKPVGSEAIMTQARAASMPYMSQRWLGGMLTNFKTTLKSVERLKSVEADIESGILKTLTKKEGIQLLSTKDKLEKSIGGVREMNELPDALFIIDAGWHKGAVREANLLGIPVVSVVDTNHSPEGVDYVIPGNDDSRQAVEIYARLMSEAIIAGREERTRQVAIAAASGNESPMVEANNR
jgi:small subunit ribosomal protein S2